MPNSNSYHGQNYTALHPSRSMAKPETRSARSRRPIQNDVHWRVPCIMTVCLILGAAAAVGHHLFYLHWNHQDVDSTAWSQQWINRAGTAFAFSVKMFLAIATGTSYVQQVWITVQSRALRIERIDSVFDVLGNALRLFDVRLWIRNPVLAGLAVVTWLLPIAAIVTPGTLTVTSAERTPITERLVPEINFSNYTRYAVLDVGANFERCTDDLFRIAVAASSGASILQIPSHDLNASYHLRFFAPAISCAAADAAISKQVENFIQAKYNGAYDLEYYSFVPQLSSFLNATFEETLGSTLNATLGPILGLNASVDFFTLDQVSPDAAYIYLRTFWYGTGNIGEKGYTPDTALLTSCKLKNASYYVDFDFSYPNQQVTVQTLDYLNDVNATAIWETFNFEFPSFDRIVYVSIMDAFGRVLVGSAGSDPDSSSVVSTLYGVTELATVLKDEQAHALIPTLESIFQNVTLSLMSNSLFRRNATQAQNTQVTTRKYINIYSYQPEDLYLAYGVAISISTICVVVGFIAIYRNNSAFTNSFSTIMRTTRDDSLDDLLTIGETTGADPLGDTIAKAKLRMVRWPGQDRFMGFHRS